MLVISWVGAADEVTVTGNIILPEPLPSVAPNLRQVAIQYPKAQQTRTRLRFAVERGEEVEYVRTATDLIGPSAFDVPHDGDIKEQPIIFDKGLPQARVWLPPSYTPGVRYPILYLADGGWTSPGSWLTDAIRSGDIAPLIVVGVDYGAEGDTASASRMKRYLGMTSGPQSPEFLAHERFLLDTVVPTIEARYGAPMERRLRAIGGASNGGVWSASMALRNPGVFGTAFVMSPGVQPAQHGGGRSSVRFYVSAGDLEPSFRWAAECFAGDIVARGGVATFASYPAGHDNWMWGRILLDNTRAWLMPDAKLGTPAALPGASCEKRRSRTL